MSNFSKRSLIAVIILNTVLIACHKESNPSIENDITIDHLNIKDSGLKINQAAWFFDVDASPLLSTTDSSFRVAGKYYEWRVISSNGCDSLISGTSFDSNEGVGSVVAMFHCSGNYQLTANIYDSVTNDLIGTTDTANISVSSDTLFETQVIKPDDVLHITPTDVYQYGLNTDSSYIWLSLKTSALYNYSQPTILNYLANNDNDNYTYSFMNLRLTSYPFLYYPQITNTGWGSIELTFYTDSIRYISIIWLGKKYSGMVEKTDKKFIFHWDYNDGVIISPKELNY
jgi:hypothetical protein